MTLSSSASVIGQSQLSCSIDPKITTSHRPSIQGHSPTDPAVMDATYLIVLCVPLFFFFLQLYFSLALWKASRVDPPIYEEPKKIRRKNGGAYLDSGRPRFRKSFTH